MRSATVALLGAILSLSTISADARSANSGYAGSDSVSTRPTPTPPRTTEKPPMIKGPALMHCYHTRERNEMGVYVHRTRCG